VIEPGDVRAVEVRRDQSMTITSAARRWFNEVPLREDSMGLMIVCPLFPVSGLGKADEIASYTSCVCPPTSSPLGFVEALRMS
jgi:hypothetical protein